MLCLFVVASAAQAAPEEVAEGSPLQTVSATQTADPAVSESTQPESTPPEAIQPTTSEPFLLPVEQHPWARFRPGAWRELQTVTETIDEKGHVVSRNITTQKEILQAVAEGKYVLLVQATVDLGGKRIVGDWKTRVLHLETDGAGPIADSRRLEDQSLLLAGRPVECQVFELRYREGARNLTDRIHYTPQRSPFVQKRETYATTLQVDTNQVDTSQEDVAIEVEQISEVTANEVPYQVGEQLLACSCLRTFRHRPKGDTLRLVFANTTVPGGEVAVWSTEFDAHGQRVRWSVTTLLAYGETSADDSDSE